MEHIYLGIMIGALVLRGVAALVRASGHSKILTIDYTKIADPEKLHHWAAKMLTQAAWGTALLAVVAFIAPFYGKLILALFCFLVFSTAVGITFGARKFRCV